MTIQIWEGIMSDPTSKSTPRKRPSTAKPKRASGVRTVPLEPAEPRALAPAAVLFADGPIAVGGACDRSALQAEDLEKALSLGLSCQLTGQSETVTLPARVLNAHKGDVILIPGGLDIISKLLRQVDPPQDFSHTVIMTRDYDQIAHSTANEGRMLEHIEFDLNRPQEFRLSENALKYLWPGAVLQSVEAAMDGEAFVDPEAPHGVYMIQGLSAHHLAALKRGQVGPVVVAPMVVKPHPKLESKALRAKLHRAADIARGYAGRPDRSSKSHYRFFGYSNPMAVEGVPAPASAGWAAGTFASVCSSFVRKVVSEAGVTMNANNGLTHYPEASRLMAANWLAGFIKNEVFKRYSVFARVLRADERAANQIVNTFVNDDANGMESLAWQHPGTGLAVSPANILDWFGPDQGGCYGHSEPLRYSPKKTVTRAASTWQAFTGFTRLKGKVTRSVGQEFVPVEGAIVRVFDGLQTWTDAQGQFVLENVPRGRYLVDTEIEIDGLRHTDSQEVNLEKAEVKLDPFLLQAPRHLDARRLEVALGFSGTEGDVPEQLGFADNRSGFVFLPTGQAVGSFNPVAFEWGDGLRARFNIGFAKRAVGKNPVKYPVDVTVHGEVRQVVSGGGQDVVASETWTFTVAGQTVDARALELRFASGLASLILTVRNVFDDWAV
jgi:hypothetical protein